jgi:RNA polymerase subunit RPABC4/transcription elongation factor Spt4
MSFWDVQEIREKAASNFQRRTNKLAGKSSKVGERHVTTNWEVIVVIIDQTKWHQLAFRFTLMNFAIGFFCELYKYRRRRSTHMHTHSYEHTYRNPTPMSTSKDCRYISRLIKSPQAPRYRRVLTAIGLPKVSRLRYNIRMIWSRNQRSEITMHHCILMILYHQHMETPLFYFQTNLFQ